MSRELFDETSGLVYLIPLTNEEFILAQVGFGGDLGVFDGLYQRESLLEELNPELLFRVHFGRRSPRKFRWVEYGMLPFKDALSSVSSYVQSAVGSDECYLVTYGREDTPVHCENAGEYEPLATWSHEHIIGRFQKESKHGLR